MPNPKSGTVTTEVGKSVTDIKSGKVEYRVDKTSIIHVPVGKISFDDAKLTENIETLVGAVVRAKPATAKGTYLKSIVVSSTMSPGVRINANRF